MDEGDVGKNGRVPSHPPVYHELAERIIQVIITANNMGNAHIMVVNNHRQHVRWATVTAQNHHIIQNLVLNGYGPLNGVFNPSAAI